MSSSVIVTVNVHDASSQQPVYRIHVQFDPFPGRNWNIAETKMAAQIWAKKLLAVDGSLRPGWLERMRYEALPALADQVLPDTAGYAIGAATSVYIDQAPPDSRLHNPFQREILFQRLRREVAAQLPAEAH